MTTTEPDVQDNGRYTVTQAAKALDVSTKTIQRHTDSGALKCIIHKATGRKLSTGLVLKKWWRATY
jgi:predicted site-specific integrase-resolvase